MRDHPSAWSNCFSDCLAYTSCGACLDALHPQCEWCVESRQCSNGTLACNDVLTFDQDECPAIISVAPNLTHANGGAMLAVFGTEFGVTLSYQCRFELDGEEALIEPAQIVPGDNSRLTCVAPSTEAGTRQLRIYTADGNEYTANSVPFTWEGTH